MTPPADDCVTLHHGDALDVLRSLPEASVDAVVTDPPYELGFMGRAWDASGIAYNVDLWKQCARVLKPGGHLLAFGGTRTYHRMACAIEDAGLELRDSISWLYGSGFPKSLDISKAIDKVAGAQREVIGTGRRSQNRSEGWDRPWMREQMEALGGSGRAEHAITAPATDEAKRWAGWGTALKPAHEPIIVARKPLAGTVAANVLAHGTGALNIDGCRVEGGPIASAGGTRRSGGIMGASEPLGGWEPSHSGRWPSNALIDEATAGQLGEPSRFFPTFRYQAKAPGSERPRVDGVAHPTVKPLDLMRWLVRLVTPPGGVVLDPFAGSGTTAEACIAEGVRCVAIEREATYLPLIQARIDRAETRPEQADVKCIAATVHDGHTHHCTIEPAPHPVDVDHMAPCDGGKRLYRWKDQPMTEPDETEAVEAPALPARKWGDEPDPLPAVPTVLVASTDPYVNTDGEGARQYAPKPALAAAKDAFAGGWRYEFTYAAAAVPERGTPGKRGHKPAHVLHTVALRLARDTEIADVPATSVGSDGPPVVHERGYAIWAREDAVATPDVEGKWSFNDAQINRRPFGARELRARLLRHGRELLNDPPVDIETAAPGPAVVPRGTTPVPVAPIVPGSWGSLHAGDTVSGGDGRPYVVQTIEHTGQWVGSGQPEVRVTVALPDGSAITVRKSATEPAVIAERSDTSPAAAVLTAAFNVTEETIVPPSTEDQFSAPATPAASLTRLDPPIGKYRWYKLPHPITGEETLWPRVSTIMKTHADKEGLTDWEIRMAMKGLAVSPDLIAMVASLDIENDKSKFREAAEQASNRAKSKSGANFGTAVDRFTERLDAGESIASMGVPEGLRAEVEAYARTLRDHGLEVLPQFTQRTTVNATHEYAGTWDRVVRRISTSELFMLDVKRTKPDAKTGRMSDYSWLEYVSQLAGYVNGEHMCTLDFTGYEPMPEVSLTKGLILHIVPDQGRGELYGVRLERGWHNFVRSIETRRDRSEAKSGWSWLIERKPEAAPAPSIPAEAAGVPADAAFAGAPSVYELVVNDILAATTIERLGEIATNAIAAGIWSGGLANLALARDDQIKARTAADQAVLAALWAELTGAGRWTPEVAAHADARAGELAQLVSA